MNRMIRIVCLVSIVLSISLMGYAQPKEIALWPAVAPYSEGLALTEAVQNRGTDAWIDRAITKISAPSIMMFPPAKPNGFAVLICPGGAYARVVVDKEGYDVARWFNSFGVTAFVLKYRLPAEGHAQPSLVPLSDAQRALRTIRKNAAEWKINPDRIGVMGFSAGGHLAASLGTLYEKKAYARVDDVDDLSARPDFMILMYPVISLEDDITHVDSRKVLIGETPTAELKKELSLEQQVTANTPKAFIALADDDSGVNPENSIRFYQALKKAKVPCELHIFREGGHGFGLAKALWPTNQWTTLCQNWLTTLP